MNCITPATACAARLIANKLVTRRNRLYAAYQVMKGQVCEDVLQKAARVLAAAETQSSAAMMEDQFQFECLAARGVLAA